MLPPVFSVEQQLIPSQKHFKKKELIILRACNELLRRLSRAEDTVFCGRVFIFLFQSFPLGDRSSVNLRGEFHVENVTVFEDLSPKTAPSTVGTMQLDNEEEKNSKAHETSDAINSPKIEDSNLSQQIDPDNENTRTDKQDMSKEKALEMDVLYPMFWALQESFSTPTRLFNSHYFQAFKEALDSTIRKFQSVHQELQSRGTSKQSDENKRALKRKRNGVDDELSNSFNPRYLTSRDLFDLEVCKDN